MVFLSAVFLYHRWSLLSYPSSLHGFERTSGSKAFKVLKTGFLQSSWDKTRFLNLGISQSLDCIVPCFGGCTVHCRMFSGILASSHWTPVGQLPSHSSQLWQCQKLSNIAKNLLVMGERNSTMFRTETGL